MNAPMELPRNALTIADTMIRQDAEGRYSFNDLHKAAVAAGHDYKTCQVEHFTRNDTTQALIDELRKNGELEIDPYVSTAGRYGGTWGCKELVYAYAMWISPAFHLKVIRAYDAMVSQPTSLNPANLSRLQLIEMAMQAEQERLALENKVEVLAPKAEALDRIATADGSLCFTDAAKTLQMRLKDLIAWLSSHKWIYQRPGTSWIGYQDKIQSGYVEHKTNTVERSDGTEKVVTQARITPKGLAKLAETFGSGTDLIAA